MDEDTAVESIELGEQQPNGLCARAWRSRRLLLKWVVRTIRHARDIFTRKGNDFLNNLERDFESL